MVAVVASALVLSVLVLADSFRVSLPRVSRLAQQANPALLQLHRLSGTTIDDASSNHEPSGILERILAFLFEALPLAMHPLTEKMDETKIRKNPPKWVKPSTIHEIRKNHDKSSYWAQQDIIDSFAKKYLPEVENGDIKVLVKKNDVYISYPPSMDSFMEEVKLSPIAAAEKHIAEEEQRMNPIQAAGEFIVDGIYAAVSPTDKPMDKSKIVANPKGFSKPLPLSKLRGILAKDPHYFKK